VTKIRPGSSCFRPAHSPLFVSGFKSITSSPATYSTITPNLIRAALRLRYQTVERLQAFSHFAQAHDCAPVVPFGFCFARQFPELRQDAPHLLLNAVSELFLASLLRPCKSTRDMTPVTEQSSR